MEAFVCSRMRKSDYGKVVLASKLLLRHGITDLMHLASHLKVPISIVSGGIKEIIQATFYAVFFNGEVDNEDIRSYFIDGEHVRVIANTFEYNNEVAVDYCRPIIHSMNKQEFLYPNSDVRCEKYQRRKNVMVMGDILDDVRMVRDSEHHVVLKVGFLNDLVKDQSKKDEYMDTFDMVILGDGSMEPVNEMLRDTLFCDYLKSA